MLGVVIGLYSLYFLLRVYISVMQIGYINQEKCKAPVLMSAKKYFTAGSYAVAKEKLSLVEMLVDYLMFLWWVMAGFAWLSGVVQVEGTLLNAVLFLYGFVGINFIVGLPFQLYGTFKIDEVYGFNKMTPGIFLSDTIKSALMFFLFGGALFALLAWIITHFMMWWLWGFVVIFAVALLINLLYPTLIAPIFNTFEPIEEGELKEEITKLMGQVGLKSDGIFSMDASKRDSRLNAYFGGIGKSKRVVLFDTLLGKLNTKELLAVLGHELGHYSHGDIWKNIGLMGVLLFIAFYLFGHLPKSLFLEMGVMQHAGAQIAMLLVLLPLVSFLFTPFMSYVSRHNEYAADEFGSQMGGRENLVSALLKLMTENKAFPKSHPLVIFFYYTHPPVLERLKALGYDATGIVVDEERKLSKEGIFTFIGDDSCK